MPRDARTLTNLNRAEILALLHAYDKEVKQQKAQTILSCPICTNDFVQTRDWHKFCSPACRTKFHIIERELKKLRGL